MEETLLYFSVIASNENLGFSFIKKNVKIYHMAMKHLHIPRFYRFVILYIPYIFNFNIYRTAMWLLRKKVLPSFALIFEVCLNQKCFQWSKEKIGTMQVHVWCRKIQSH